MHLSETTMILFYCAPVLLYLWHLDAGTFERRYNKIHCRQQVDALVPFSRSIIVSMISKFESIRFLLLIEYSVVLLVLIHVYYCDII